MQASCEQFAGPNTTKVQFDNVTLWFSYHTLVGFQVGGGEIVVTDQKISHTTSKHINTIGPAQRKACLISELNHEYLNDIFERYVVPK